MTSLLAVALAVSTFVVPTSLAQSPHACCRHVAAHQVPASVQCCLPARERAPQQAPPPQAPTTPAPDLSPLLPDAAILPPATVPTSAAVAHLRRLVIPPPLYLLHSTLLV